jgi:hypothetical protein
VSATDGWLDWTERVPGPPDKVYRERNVAAGYVAHSMVGGYAGAAARLFASELDAAGAYTTYAAASWHFSVLASGSVIQHYPLAASCWASGSRVANTRFVAVETEGGGAGNESETLTEPQVDAYVRLIRDVAASGGWAAIRPQSAADTSATLWEHREMTRFGSAPTLCPSGRIPWPEIVHRLEKDGGEMWTRLNGQAAFWHDRVLTQTGDGVMRLDIDFPQLPPDASAVDLEVFLHANSGGRLTIRDGSGNYAGRFGPQRIEGVVRAVPRERTLRFAVEGTVTVALIGIVGYLR